MAIKGQTHTNWCRVCNTPAKVGCLYRKHELVALKVNTPANVKGTVQ
jgi:hypothetical protein